MTSELLIPPMPVAVTWHDACYMSGEVDPAYVDSEVEGIVLQCFGLLIRTSEDFIRIVFEQNVDGSGYRHMHDIPFPNIVKIEKLQTGEVIYDKNGGTAKQRKPRVRRSKKS